MFDKDGTISNTVKSLIYELEQDNVNSEDDMRTIIYNNQAYIDLLNGCGNILKYKTKASWDASKTNTPPTITSSKAIQTFLKIPGHFTQMMKDLDNCRSKSSEPLRTDIDRLYRQLSKIPEDKIADETTVQILLANISTLHACDIYRIINQHSGGTKKRKNAKRKEKGKRKRTVKSVHYYL